jgi:multidrug efflux system membrane fusion protein
MSTNQVAEPAPAGSSIAPKADAPVRQPGRGRRWFWIFLFAILIVGGIWVYRLRSASQVQSAAKQGRGASTVEVALGPVSKKDVPLYLRGLGSVSAFNTVTVRSRVDGQLIQVAFKEGQFVHAGELLAVIDPRPFQVALDQALGQQAKDTASLNVAKLDLDRDQKLLQDGIIPKQQLDSQVALVEQSKGVLQSDQAQIDNQKLQLTYCRITAPIAGRVGLRLVDEGNIVHATDPNGLLVITQVQPIAVLFTIAEDSLPEVVKQMRGGTQLHAFAYSRDDNTKLADGKLLTLDNEIDPTTGMLKLKAQFANQDLSLWPNQFVNIWLLLTVRKDAVVVPSVAIQRGTQGSTFVYLVGPDNKAQVQNVKLDFSEGTDTVVASGLQAGQQVVVDGQDKLQAGMVVQIRGSGTGTGGTGAGGNASGAGGGGSAPQPSPKGGSASKSGGGRSK